MSKLTKGKKDFGASKGLDKPKIATVDSWEAQ